MDASKNPNNPADNSLHFLDYWRIIRIRKTVILAVFLLVVLTTTAVSFFLKETYKSTVRLEVEKDSSDITPLLPVATRSDFDPYFINTEFEKIESQMVLDHVISDLDLNRRWSERFGFGKQLKLSESRQILERMVDLSLTRNTSLIEISVYSEDKVEAAEIANKIAEVYAESRLALVHEASDKGIEALKKWQETQYKKVTDLQAEVDALRDEFKISDIDMMGGMQSSTLEQETVRHIERQRVNAQDMMIQYDTTYKELMDTASNNPAALPYALGTAHPDSGLMRLMGELEQARQRFAVAIKDRRPDHPEVVQITALIKETEDLLKKRVEGILEGLSGMVEQQKARLNDLDQQLANAKQEDADNYKTYRPYFMLRRQLENEQRILDDILVRIVQEQVDKELPRMGMVRVIDKAEVSDRPVSPKILLNVTLGVIVGLIMGFGLAFFIEYLDTSVKTIDDVERALQAPVLGVIPQNVGSLLEEGPDSPHAEAYRVLRTNILFSRKKPDARTVTVVSGGAGEGKSTTIFNLATVFAQNGARVLVVDSDLRRPSLHKFLNISNTMGLTNYLLKQNSLEEVIQTTAYPLLHFLPSGKLPSSSLGVLNSAKMKEFIAEVRERYDFVFFDSPPIMGVSDASILASEVDIALLVVQYRKYPQMMTVRAKQMVEKVGGTLLGVVLNNINISQDSYYYYYSGYYYDYYSKHDDDSAPKKNGEAKKGSERSTGAELKQKY